MEELELVTCRRCGKVLQRRKGTKRNYCLECEEKRLIERIKRR